MNILDLAASCCAVEHGSREDVLKTYLLLHQKKLGAHWMWIAIERIAAGEPEEKVFAEYGYKWDDKLRGAHGRDRSDPDLCDVCYWRTRAAKAADAERAACANMLNLSRSDALLMAGEMTAQEWRTLSAVLVALQQRMRSNAEITGSCAYG